MKQLLVIMAVFTSTYTVSAQTTPKKTNADTSRNATEATYTCPMHPGVVSHKPGKCPKCGMDLTLSKKDQKKMEGMKMYTCPMHEDVASDKPGDCPKCGMKLVEKKKVDHSKMKM